MSKDGFFGATCDVCGWRSVLVNTMREAEVAMADHRKVGCDYDAPQVALPRLRSLLVEARDALRRVGNSSTDAILARIEEEVGK